MYPSTTMWSLSLLVLLFSSHPSLSFQSALPNPFSFFRLDTLPPHIMDVRFNETMGHSDSLLAIGINNKEIESDVTQADREAIVEPVDVRNYLIPISELAGALEKALDISSKNHEEIKKSGWKVVHQSEIFSLFKRRLKRAGSGDGPVEYLMTGTLPDVSPRTFLHSQIDKQCRKQWDKTMKDMSEGSTTIMEAGGEESEDILYYRTKWPWPLKDRDYTLARRCKLFEDKNAIVLVSKSVECPDRPSTDGVIRVDNYWCHSAIISTRPIGPSPSATKPNTIDTSVPPQDAVKQSSVSGSLPAPPSPSNSNSISSSSSTGSSGSGSSSSSSSPYGRENKPHRPRKFDPRARLNELKRNANMKGGSAFAAKLRSKAREALLASRTSYSNFQDARKVKIEKKEELAKTIDVNPCIQLAVDLPGMSFITLFCDDQKVPLPSTIVDILSKQGEKVVPESINRLHEIAREVEDRKQQLLGTTVEAAMASSSSRSPRSNDETGE